MSGNLLTRDDTFLGVCEGLGQDFGINSNWLRLAFAVSLLWNPTAVIGAYLAAGLVVAAARLIVREPRPAPTAVLAETAADASAEEASADEAQAEARPEPVALAA